MDQREWDYGARMSRERRAAEAWPTREPEPDSEPRWASLTDTGSMAPSDEALSWQRRADAWAQQAEVEVYGGGGQNVEPTANRWSDVASTGRTAFPADGQGWRTETSEWRATGARWRQTTEWRSSTGSHVWRSTTEAWQSEEELAAANEKPAIQGTAWPTPEQDDTGTGPASWQRRATTPVEQTPSWQRSTGSWNNRAPDQPPGENTTGLARWERTDAPGWQTSPAEDAQHLVRDDDRAAWQRDQSPRRGRRRAPEPDSTPSGGSGWSTASEPDSWERHTDTGSIPAWGASARPGGYPDGYSDSPSSGFEDRSGGYGGSDAFGARSGGYEAGSAGYSDRSEGYGGRPGGFESGGFEGGAEAFGARSGGFDGRSGGRPGGAEAGGFAEGARAGDGAGSRRARRRAAEPDAYADSPADTGTGPTDTPQAPGGRPRRYNQGATDWREDTASWTAEPDTSNWTRDPDTGQWSRAEDDPRVLAWRAEAARRESLKTDSPPADEAPRSGRRARRDGPRLDGPAGGVPGGPLPSSGMPSPDAAWPTSSVPDEPASGSRGMAMLPIPRSGMPSNRQLPSRPSSAVPGSPAPYETGQFGAGPSRPGDSGQFGSSPSRPADSGQFGSSPSRPADSGQFGSGPSRPGDSGPFGPRPGESGQFGSRPADTGQFGSGPAGPGDTGSFGAGGRRSRDEGSGEGYATGRRRRAAEPDPDSWQSRRDPAGPLPPRRELPSGGYPANPAPSAAPSWQPDVPEPRRPFGSPQQRALPGGSDWSADPARQESRWDAPGETGVPNRAWPGTARPDQGRPDSWRDPQPSGGTPSRELPAGGPSWNRDPGSRETTGSFGSRNLAGRAGAPDSTGSWNRDSAGRPGTPDTTGSWNRDAAGRPDSTGSWAREATGRPDSSGSWNRDGSGSTWNRDAAGGRDDAPSWQDTSRPGPTRPASAPSWQDRDPGRGPSWADSARDDVRGAAGAPSWRDPARDEPRGPSWQEPRDNAAPSGPSWQTPQSSAPSWQTEPRGPSWQEPARDETRGPSRDDWQVSTRGPGGDSWQSPRQDSSRGPGWQDTSRSGRPDDTRGGWQGGDERGSRPGSGRDDRGAGWVRDEGGRPSYGAARALPAGPSRDETTYGSGTPRALPAGNSSWQEDGPTWNDGRKPPYGSGGPDDDQNRPGGSGSDWPGSGGAGSGGPGYRGPAYDGSGGPAYGGPRSGGSGSGGAGGSYRGSATGSPAWSDPARQEGPEQRKPAYGTPRQLPAGSAGSAGSAGWPDPLSSPPRRASVPGYGSAEPWNNDAPPAATSGYGDTGGTADWLAAERATGRRSADYRDGAGQGGETDWRQSLGPQSDLAEGESRRYDTSDFPPFRPSGSATVDGSANLALSATSVISTDPEARAGTTAPVGDAPGPAPARGPATWRTGPEEAAGTKAATWRTGQEEAAGTKAATWRTGLEEAAGKNAATAGEADLDTSWPPRRSTGAFQGTGSYERRPVTSGLVAAGGTDLLDPDDDEEDEETSSSPLAAVGYTVVWYGVPVVLFVAGMFLLNSGQRNHALDTLADAAPEFAVSLVLSMIVAFALRRATTAWKSASVGLAAAVVGGGLATVLSSAITGNSLS
ncbi:hypothetical protein [Actinoplanes sp. NPDC023714]|uniref:hypothetical protein n=1 Tax=Actinoplanes sp. NPDC023714 TaxID=3154322 RepID=UPI0033EA05B8